MTLNTDSSKVKKHMNTETSFQVGIACAFLGISQIHGKLIPELKLRTTLANALHDGKVISDKIPWEDYIGFLANVKFEMRSSWFNRMQKLNAPKPLTKKELKEIGI